MSGKLAGKQGELIGYTSETGDFRISDPIGRPNRLAAY